jgi:hypothetical protein
MIWLRIFIILVVFVFEESPDVGTGVYYDHFLRLEHYAMEPGEDLLSRLGMTSVNSGD